MKKHCLFVLSGALLSAVPASAQTIIPLVHQGDIVNGVGQVLGIQRVAVNDNGDWLVEVSTDNPNPALDEAILRDGTLFQEQGVALAQPAGASLNDFLAQSLRANNADGAFIWSLTGTAGGTTDNQGVYMNQQLVLQKGTTPMGAVWGAGTVYNSFSWAKLNTANQLCLRGFNTDPTTTPTNDYYVSIIQLDGANNAISETVAARAGQILPGQTFGVNTVRTSQDSSGFNNFGHVIYGVSLTGAPGTSDSVVYMWNGTTNTLLAQEGLPSPVAGRNWSDLLSPEMALNDAGDWLIKDKLDGATASDEIIVTNGAKFIQEGDTLPSIGGTFTFTSFGNAPVSLTAAGNVCWYGDWNDPLTTMDTGIFLDQELLVQEGVTVDSIGRTFNALLTAGTSATAGQNNLLYVSPNGRYVIFSARESTNVFGAFLLDRGLVPVTSFCAGDGTGTACPCGNSGGAGRGCANSVNPTGAVLTTTGSGSVTAADLLLAASGMGNSSSCLFFQGTTQISAGAGAVFGDGLRCVGGSIIRLGVQLVGGGNSLYPLPGDPPVTVKGMIPAGGGVTEHYQCWYRNAGPFCTPSTFNLTNGVTVVWSP